MILLPHQFQMIIFHFIMGWLFSFSFHFLNTVFLYSLRKNIRYLVEFSFFTLYTLLFYILLYELNGAVTQFYCILFFFFGIGIYQIFYYSVFHSFIFTTKIVLHRFACMLYLAFSRILGILNMDSRFKKWRYHIAKTKSKSSAKKKKKTPKTSGL